MKAITALLEHEKCFLFEYLAETNADCQNQRVVQKYKRLYMTKITILAKQNQGKLCGLWKIQVKIPIIYSQKNTFPQATKYFNM